MPKIAALSLCLGLICAASARAEPPPAVQAFLDSLKPLAGEDVTLFAIPPQIAFNYTVDAERLVTIACEFKAKAGQAGGRELLRLLSDPAPKVDVRLHSVELRIGVIAGDLKFYLDNFGVVRGAGSPLIYSREKAAAIRRLARSADFTLVDAHGADCTKPWREIGQ